ncbi:transient receptor potential cation channel protein painless-like [Planococcus citri]|uniref:transient receptor potential cation channel protein painless-like n=1 Tax=Planococcus citri TaxID=170843 RepID=UPI0031F8CAE9
MQFSLTQRTTYSPNSTINHIQDSSNPSSDQLNILVALKQQKLDDFTALIKSRDIDVNYFYSDPENGTLLDIACRSSGNSKFVQVLLRHKVNLNVINKVTGLAAIHEAVANTDEDTLKVLIESTTPEGFICSLNTPDKSGNTALHMVVKQNKVKFMTILLQKCCLRIDINQSTRQNPTPLHLALLEGNIEAASVLLEYPEIDLDFQKDSQGRTCRQIIQEEYPQLADKLSSLRSSCKVESILFSLIIRRETKPFIELASQVDVELLDENYDHQTFLHYACQYGCADVVDMLLEKQVDINKKSIAGHTPIMLAAKHGHYDIFMRLLTHPEIRLQVEGIESVLHTVILDMFSHSYNSRREHYRYLELLLNEAIPRGKLDINFVDRDGWTPLHYAVWLNDQRAVDLLIRAGANLCQRNPKGEVPLTSIKAAALTDLLDSCISSSNESAFAGDYEITFDYKILTQRSSNDKTADEREMAFFSILKSAPELRKLLIHPILKSFLHMKWYLVKKYYIIHFFFFLTFSSMLSWYIIILNTNDVSKQPSPSYTIFVFSVLLILYFMLVLREVLKLCISFAFFIKSPENWMRIVLIFTTFQIVTIENPQLGWRVSAAIAMLTSWMHMMLLIGKHPDFSTHIEMFKRVALNFFRYLLPFSILILAFAFSFHVLLADDENPQGANTEVFNDLFLKLFKMIIMLTGEIDSQFVSPKADTNTSIITDSMNITSCADQSPPTSQKITIKHLFFVLFIFLISIVLYNLLNGLAVSDTKAIREDAELIGIVSQIEFISFLELFLTIRNRNPFEMLNRFIPNCGGPATFCQKMRLLYSYVGLYRHDITLFPESSSDTCVRVLPYRSNAVVFPEDDNSMCNRALKSHRWKMDPSIIRQAVEILEKRDNLNQTDHLGQCLQLIQKQQTKFQDIEKAIQQVSSQLNNLKSEIDERFARLGNQ